MDKPQPPSAIKLMQHTRDVIHSADQTLVMLDSNGCANSVLNSEFVDGSNNSGGGGGGGDSAAAVMGLWG